MAIQLFLQLLIFRNNIIQIEKLSRRQKHKSCTFKKNEGPIVKMSETQPDTV